MLGEPHIQGCPGHSEHCFTYRTLGLEYGTSGVGESMVHIAALALSLKQQSQPDDSSPSDLRMPWVSATVFAVLMG